MAQLQIGASIEAVNAARAGILEILGERVGDNVKIAALECFKSICEVKNTSVTSCVFNGDMASNEAIKYNIHPGYISHP